MSDRGLAVTEEPPVWRRSTSPRQPVPDVLIDSLVNEGVEVIFGIPGGAINPIIAALERKGLIRFVLARHEGGAAFMADCYARVRATVGVCLATTGPGATNLLTGVAAACADSVPLLVLTGMNPTHSWGLGDFQESTVHGIDTVGLFRHVTKMSDVVASEKLLQPMLRRAFALARSGRPGPVHLAIARDVLARSVSPDVWPAPSYHSLPPGPSPEDLARVSRALERAERPMIIVGSGAATAAADVCALSNHLVIPLIATPRAKGLFSGSPARYYLGTMGISAHPRVDRFLAVARCDLVLAIGSGFGSYATNSWDPGLCQGRMIQVNIDPAAIGRVYPADLGIVSDAAVFARALMQQTGQARGDPRAEGRRQHRARWLESCRVADEPQGWPMPSAAGHGRLAPVEIVRAVDQAVPEHGIILVDSGSMLLWATHYLPERRGRRFISVWGAASMGHVTAGAVGAKLAAPDRAVVALVGDGCFFMNGMEVATAVQHHLAVVWIVNVNGQLGMTHYEQRPSGLTAASELGRCDIAQIALGLGARGLICRDFATLVAAVAGGFAHAGPTVIQVDVDPEPVPPIGGKKAGSTRWHEYIDRI
ncbi:MAG: thiamine pyrophosphate-binding protein [Acidiferrobacteraceae bacterium]